MNVTDEHPLLIKNLKAAKKRKRKKAAQPAPTSKFGEFKVAKGMRIISASFHSGGDSRSDWDKLTGIVT